MAEEFYKANVNAASVRTVTADAKSQFIIQIAKKYNNPEQVEQLEKASKKVEEGRVKIHEDVKDAIMIETKQEVFSFIMLDRKR